MPQRYIFAPVSNDFRKYNFLCGEKIDRTRYQTNIVRGKSTNKKKSTELRLELLTF